MAIDSATARLPVARSSRTAQLTIVAYIVALVAAQASASLFSIEVSVACNAALLLVLLNHFAFAPASAEVRPAFVGLALVPLLRIESIALPQSFIPSVYWEALPLALVLATVFWLQRLAIVGRRLAHRTESNGRSGVRATIGKRADVSGSVNGYRWRPRALRSSEGPESRPSGYAWPVQGAISLLGVWFAVGAAYALFALDLAGERPGLVSSPPSALLVAGFSGVALEIVFRGMIQPELVALFGWNGVVLTSLVYAAVFIGFGWFFVVLALGTGLVWGAFSAHTGRVSGVAGSHALFAMTWAALF